MICCLWSRGQNRAEFLGIPHYETMTPGVNFDITDYNQIVQYWTECSLHSSTAFSIQNAMTNLSDYFRSALELCKFTSLESAQSFIPPIKDMTKLKLWYIYIILLSSECIQCVQKDTKMLQKFLSTILLKTKEFNIFIN
jgi:hypothetical protein